MMSMSTLDSCRWVRIQIPRFIDDELPSDLAGRVSFHLDRCPGCRSSLAIERNALLDTIGVLVTAEPRAGLVDAVFGRLDRETLLTQATIEAAPVRPVAGFLAYAPAAAAAAVLALVLWVLPVDAPVISDSPSLANSSDPIVIPGSNDFADGVDDSSEVPLATDMVIRRGDVDGNGRFEAADVRGLIRYLHDGQKAPICLAAADFDEDGAITMRDSVIAAQSLVELTKTVDVVFAYESNTLPCQISCP